MAGSINDNGVFWNVGDTTGRDNAGVSTAIPLGGSIGSGTAAPTAAPSGIPLYWDTDTTDNLYIWVGTAWKGPYNKGT